MPIPKVRLIMLPLLKFAGDEKEHSCQEAINYLAQYFELTDEERLKPYRGDDKRIMFTDRVYQARSYLKNLNLFCFPYHGTFIITLEGIRVLKGDPQSVHSLIVSNRKNVSVKKFKENKSIDSKQINRKEKNIENAENQKKILETAYYQLQEVLKAELLNTVKKHSSNFFETLVVDLLVSMGYGGSREEAGQAVGKSGDEGIDGIIKEDRLGLEIVYLQAKRWKDNVGRPEIQKFAGALQGKKAKKGVFITTSDFTKGAIDYVTRIDSKIILVNGARLAELMIEHNVGVTSIAKYEVKKIDSDYFIED